MRNKIKTLVTVSSLIASSAITTVYAQDSSPMSCYWQVDSQNELGIWERQLCSNPQDASLPDVFVASRGILLNQNHCSVSWFDGYRTELKGTVEVEGDKSACYGHSVSFRPEPETRIVDGIQEQLLNCRWDKQANNIHKLMCDEVDGGTIGYPVATKIQAENSAQCLMSLNSFTLDLFQGGKAVIDKEPASNACDLAPVYFRPFPAKRLIEGVEASLLQCTWQDMSDSMRVKVCSNVGASNKQVAVAFMVNGQQQSTLDSANRGLKTGQIIEDKTLNPAYPPLYFKPNLN
ncbi:hypothetical protein L1285_14185 [Pseudoalteromonas sp. DL2-H2.2]|uniref:hypothetical protein n=1 Tax=Pseudoalteromonas sp. DL2-H2.2 TaxID=2908889 RepID=UPI001F22AD7B|nr:hypothetical protein [Pseudoalteromonas sp. DL2-H2.2]MCF2909470.1 hypothetical protein [Pseudoalteromonas sp. DL2-H2.2]